MKDIKEKFIVVIYLIIFGVIFYNLQQCMKEPSAKEKAKEVHCAKCNKDLTKDYNRIAPTGKEYYCTPCYKQMMRGIHEEMRFEGYD